MGDVMKRVWEKIYECPCGFVGEPISKDIGVGWNTYGSSTKFDSHYVPACPECHNEFTEEEELSDAEVKEKGMLI